MKPSENPQLSTLNSPLSTLHSPLIPPGYKQTEVGVIPEDWEIRSTGELCWVNQGLQIPISNRLKNPSPTSRRYLTIQYLNEGKEVEYIDFYNPAVCCTQDDVLMTRTGNTGIVITNVEGVFHNNFFKIHYNKKLLRKKYLVYYFRQDRIQRLILIKAGTSTIPDLNHKDFYSIPIVVPTFFEQEAIAEALSDADALIESLEQLLTKKRHLKQGTMQELLTGKRRLPGFEVNPGYKQTEVGTIPEDWHPTTIGDLAIKVGSGITPKGGSSRYKEYGRPFVRSQNVGWGTLLLSELAYIDDDTHNNFSTTELRQDDVLLNITGASIGRSAIADACLAGGNVNQHVCIIRTDTGEIAPRFINYFLLSDLGQRQIDSFQAGGNREGLNFGQIRSIKLPLPPTKAEQTAIAAILSDMDTEIAALETKLAKTHQLKQGMMQELLTGRTRLV